MRNLNFLAAPLKVVVIATLTLVVGSAGAQQAPALQSYDVELIIFRTLSLTATPEDWAKETNAGQPLVLSDDESPAPGAAVASAPIATATETFPAVVPGKLKLTALADTLRRGGHMSVGVHTAPGQGPTVAACCMNS